MDEMAKTLPKYQAVSDMNGVGSKTRSRLIAETGDVTRFRNARCLIAYCGIDAPPYQSGQFQANNRHIRKMGRLSENSNSAKIFPTNDGKIEANFQCNSHFMTENSDKTG